MTAALRAFVEAELARPVAEEVAVFAAELAKRGGPATTAVLFYGSGLRTGDLDGVLDFYVLAERPSAWLPPTVEYLELTVAGRRLRAKAAILRPDQFRRLAGRAGLDISVWARFAQPAALVWSRDAAAHADAVESVVRAAATAGWWAARLGPQAGPAAAFWNTLFSQTYAADLRIEPKGRERAILGGSDPRYAALLPLAWTAAGVAFEGEGPAGTLQPRLTEGERRRARAAWRLRRGLGKPLTVLRLAKAVFTFQGAADYAAWKIERHTGFKVEVTPWRRRFPLLAAPGLAWRLWRAGVLR
ncbi:MAG TPA: hypothetical protein VL358_03105 [Caulobacteraceae bacterium]|jgi:hypothetical protein|nr:hypothetical protein [Caulobacteraceae bacterium]